MSLRKISKKIPLFLILISIIYFIYYNYYQYNLKRNQNENIDIFFENYNNNGNQINFETYLMVLEIPKINLKKGIYEKDSYKNNIDLNVSILKESDLPNIEKGTLLLAAHSGNSIVSYFKDLNKLQINDEIFIYFENKKYNYIVNNIYTINKSDGFYLSKNFDKRLILITCLDDYKYLIIESIENNNY